MILRLLQNQLHLPHRDQLRVPLHLQLSDQTRKTTAVVTKLLALIQPVSAEPTTFRVPKYLTIASPVANIFAQSSKTLQLSAKHRAIPVAASKTDFASQHMQSPARWNSPGCLLYQLCPVTSTLVQTRSCFKLPKTSVPEESHSKAVRASYHCCLRVILKYLEFSFDRYHIICSLYCRAFYRSSFARNWHSG